MKKIKDMVIGWLLDDILKDLQTELAYIRKAAIDCAEQQSGKKVRDKMGRWNERLSKVEKRIQKLEGATHGRH